MSAGGFGHDRQAVTRAHGRESEALARSLQPQRWGLEQLAGQSPTSALAPGVNEQSAPGGKPWRYVPVRGCLLVIYRFSFSCSRLLRQRARMTTGHFTLWATCSFCCFCPHRMFLSAPCEGTGNYRAIHLHPHPFRQILGEAGRWRWRKTFCCFCGFSFKEERAISFLVKPLMVHSSIQQANRCLFSVYLMLVCVGPPFILSTNTPITHQGDWSWPISTHAAPSWLLLSPRHFHPSSQPSPFSYFSQAEQLSCSVAAWFKPYPLGLTFYSTYSLIQPRFIKSPSSK